MTEKDAIKCRDMTDSRLWAVLADAVLSDDFAARLDGFAALEQLSLRKCGSLRAVRLSGQPALRELDLSFCADHASNTGRTAASRRARALPAPV